MEVFLLWHANDSDSFQISGYTLDQDEWATGFVTIQHDEDPPDPRLSRVDA